MRNDLIHVPQFLGDETRSTRWNNGQRVKIEVKTAIWVFTNMKSIRVDRAVTVVLVPIHVSVGVVRGIRGSVAVAVAQGIQSAVAVAAVFDIKRIVWVVTFVVSVGVAVAQSMRGVVPVSVFDTKRFVWVNVDLDLVQIVKVVVGIVVNELEVQTSRRCTIIHSVRRMDVVAVRKFERTLDGEFEVLTRRGWDHWDEDQQLGSFNLSYIDDMRLAVSCCCHCFCVYGIVTCW